MTIDRQSTFLPDERMIHRWCGRHLHFEDAIVARSERLRKAEEAVMRTMRQIPGTPGCMLKQPRLQRQPRHRAEALVPDVRAHSRGGTEVGDMTEEQIKQDLEARLKAAEAARDRARAAGQLERYMEEYCRVESIEEALLSRPWPAGDPH